MSSFRSSFRFDQERYACPGLACRFQACVHLCDTNSIVDLDLPWRLTREIATSIFAAAGLMVSPLYLLWPD